MWFLLFIGTSSMSEEIRRGFNDKAFSYISEEAILKSRSKIKVSAFEQLFNKFNDTLENVKKYKGYRVIAVDGLDFSLLYKYGRANNMELPCTVSFRLVKVSLKDKWLVMATNLSHKEFSARTLKTLYEKRWKIEVAFRDIKHALGALCLHSKKDLFNLQEFFAHLIRYNLTSRIICQIRLPKPKNLKYRYEVNFKNAAQIIQNFCRLAFGL